MHVMSIAVGLFFFARARSLVSLLADMLGHCTPGLSIQDWADSHNKSEAFTATVVALLHHSLSLAAVLVWARLDKYANPDCIRAVFTVSLGSDFARVSQPVADLACCCSAQIHGVRPDRQLPAAVDGQDPAAGLAGGRPRLARVPAR